MEYVAVLDSPEGDVLLKGTSTVTVSSKGEALTYILPSMCVKTDSEGSYIFRLSEKNSIFGKSYYADKVEITIEAENGYQTAVDSQEILHSAEIIYSTTLPLYDGSIVSVQ